MEMILHNRDLLLGSSVAEQVTVNHLVAGSNPARAAIFILYLGYFFLFQYLTQASVKVYGEESYDLPP